jgi:small-conductance mechanosensitive channel
VVVAPEHFYRDDQLTYPNEEDFERAFRQSSRSTFTHNLPFYVIMAIGLLVVAAIVFVVVGAVAGLLSWLAANLVTILMWGLAILACILLLGWITGGKLSCPGLHCGGCGG